MGWGGVGWVVWCEVVWRGVVLCVVVWREVIEHARKR